MPSPSNKKLMLLYIYRILKEYSDEEHPLTQQDIIDKISANYGMDSERKAVSANLLSLEDCGFHITTVPNRGVYLGQREFEPSEVTFLVDAVFSSREINSKQSQKLAEKLFAGFSVYQKKKYKYIYKSDGITRTDNKQQFYLIDLLNQAIEEKKQVSFDYISYTVGGKIEKPATVSPYYLINSNGKYYLVCSRHRDWGISNYRIERMNQMRILDKPAVPIEQVKGAGKKFDIVKYANENIYMFGGQTVSADLWVKTEAALAYVYDWFGKSVRARTENNQIRVTVKATETALVYWLLQYGESVEILQPETTRDKVKDLIKKLSETYRIDETAGKP